MSEREENRRLVRGVFAVLKHGVSAKPRPLRQRRRRTSKAARERAYHQRMATTYVLINGFPHERDAEGNVRPL
jgi:hypothetical protein